MSCVVIICFNIRWTALHIGKYIWSVCCIKWLLKMSYRISHLWHGLFICCHLEYFWVVLEWTCILWNHVNTTSAAGKTTLLDNRFLFMESLHINQHDDYLSSWTLTLRTIGHCLMGTSILLYTNPFKRECRPYSKLEVLVNLWVVHCRFFLLNMLWAQQICYPACGQEATVCFCAWHSAPHDTVHGMPRLPVSPVQLLQPHWTNIHSPLPVSLLQHYNAEIELRTCLNE